MNHRRHPGFLFRLGWWPLALLAGFALQCLVRADEFDALRLKWRDMETGGTNLNLADSIVQSRLTSIANAANSYWSTMDVSAGRTYLWSDAARTNQSEDITTCYNRLRAMALAWATRGCSLEGNATLASNIVSGLDWMYANRYNETKTEYDNWWDWEIGSPQSLNNTAVLMYDVLTATQITNYNKAVDKFVPVTADTGANRTDEALVVAIRGILGRNTAKMINARDGLSPVFPYVTAGDGFYRDGSFIQHTRHPYTGSYGSVLIDGVSKLMWLLSGSTWQVTDPSQSNVFRWVYDSYQPVIYKGATMDNLRGRAISRQGSTDHSAGAGNLSSILQIAQFAPPADAAAFKSMLKYWIQTDTARNFTNNVALNLMPQTRELMADTNVLPRGELIGHYQFPNMDRVVHLRPGFGFALSMSSSRVYTYECINSENLRGWFTGDGMTTLYNDDLGQFSGNFWPTVDPYHLPGTTVDQTIRTNASGQSVTTGQNWVGGASLNSNFGIAGMSLDAQVSSLVARKSWFMFDNEIVCLGAGVTCAGTNPVHTTVENRRLAASATNQFIVDGSTKSTALGWSGSFAGANWAWLAGAGGYYFPGGGNVEALRQARTNAWWDINQLSLPTSILTNPVVENYLTLWFNHAAKPTNATYVYTLLPNLTASQTAAYVAAPDVVVLVNTTNAQAVRETSLGITAANFWNQGTNSADLITVNGKSSVVVRETNNAIEVALSDPTQTNTGSIVVTLNRAATWLVSADAGVTVQQLTPQIRVAVAVNGSRGKSFRATFSTDPHNPNPKWDANGSSSGAQDGDGTWNSTLPNWWDGVTNVVWNDGASPMATFGNGGAAGTVTVVGAHSASTLIFAPVATGSYALTGGGSLALNSGITANASAAIDVPLTLNASQVWTVTTNQTLSLGGNLSAGVPVIVSLAGGGAINLSGGTNQNLTGIDGLNFIDGETLGIGAGNHAVAELTLNNGAFATISGSGSLSITGASDFRVGGDVAGAAQALDLSRLGSFNYNAPFNALSVGGQTSTVTGSGHLTLATNSVLTTGNLGVQNIFGGTSVQSAGTMRLGQSTTINTDSASVGLVRDSGLIAFAAGVTSPTLVIRGSDGVSRSGTWKLGTRSSSFFSANAGVIDLVTNVSGLSVLDAKLGDLLLADEGYCLTTNASLNGLFVMGAGTLDATNIKLGSKSSVTNQSTGIVNATFSQTNGGTVIVGTLMLGDRASGNSGALNANYLLGGGGILRAQSMQPGADAATRTFDWSDGTVRNYDSATDLSVTLPSMTLLGSGLHAFNIDAGRIGTVSCVLQGSGSLTKTGAGRLVLTSSNSFTGNVTVQSGTLALSGSGSFEPSPLISVETGALLDVAGVSGSFSIRPSQMLKGNGVVRGNVQIQGVLAPGNSIGTLTFSNNLTLAGATVMELSRNGGVPASDQITVLGNLALGGSLVLTNVGTNALRWGDAFKLFNALATVGGFTNILWPSLTAPLFWTNRLALDGSVAVLSAVSTAPTNLACIVNGNQLQLSWPVNQLGWHLETQTNALSDGLGGTWFPVAGSSSTNAVNLPVDATRGSVFFRLVYP